MGDWVILQSGPALGLGNHTFANPPFPPLCTPPLGCWSDGPDWSFHSLNGEVGLHLICSPSKLQQTTTRQTRNSSTYAIYCFSSNGGFEEILKIKLAWILTLAAYEMTTLENHFLVKNLLLANWALFTTNIRNGLSCNRTWSSCINSIACFRQWFAMLVKCFLVT